MSPFRSIRLRLTLWYLVVVALTLAAFGAGVYFALRQVLYANLDDSLEGRVEIVAALAAGTGRLDLSGVQIPGDPAEGEEFVRIYDAAGSLVFDNSREANRPALHREAITAALAGGTTRRQAEAGGVIFRVITAPLPGERGVVGAVEVALTEDDVRGTLGSLLLIIALAYPAALIVTSVGGVFLTGRALSPIDQLTRVARRISAEDLSQRLDLALPDDEVGRLAATFDDMIARLEEAFQRQRQFTADASHELRTPLTAIKGQAEVALQRDRPAEEYRQVLRRVNLEADRLIRLVSSMLTLARADAARIPINRERISLKRVVSDALDSMRPAAGENGLTLAPASDDAVLLVADQDLLLQLLINLLDNAIKSTANGGVVGVSWRREGSDVAIVVRDTGAGIAAEHLPHIFERFYRVAPGRSRGAGGAGLGLSICRWIAEAHGGSIEAQSTPGEGSTFTVRLPAS